MVKLPAPDPIEPAAVAPNPSSPTDVLPAAWQLDLVDRQIALIVSAVTFALYLRTLAPDMLPGDSGEFQFAAWKLGLAHPTGYPFYLLLGWLWQHALAWLGLSPAWALNAMSAFLAAVGLGLLYLVMAQWTPPPNAARRLVGLYSTLLLAGNLTYWSQALIAEVYALHVALMMATLLATQAFVARADSTRLLLLAVLAGLSLTHHALTLLWLPALLLYWLLAKKEGPRLPWSSWALALGVGLLPLLLYAYIPLRAGPQASPWYHQRLGDDVLSLYHNDWASFWAFISGQSIGAGFRTAADGLAQISQAAWLWHYHFGWVGLVMIAAGLLWLAVTRRYAILIPTLLYAGAQQLFNLFYNIGDILVYYIPLYVVGSMWAGFGLAGLVTGEWRFRRSAPSAAASPTAASAAGAGAATLGRTSWLLAGSLLALALRLALISAGQIDQSGSSGTRQKWESILAATPAPDAILVSNDRNEIVPLFYLQAVEQRATGMTGLFPALAPDARFADIGATLQTALVEGEEQPVYLIKEMPGLEIRFELQAAMPPLVQVLGPVAAAPSEVVDEPYGPLRLLGYDLMLEEESADIALTWQVDEPPAEKYVATVQLLDANDRKIAQDDYAPGGDYYPTSLWKAGDKIVLHHHLRFAGPLPENLRLLTGFYRPSDLALLAPPLIVPLER